MLILSWVFKYYFHKRLVLESRGHINIFMRIFVMYFVEQGNQIFLKALSRF